MEPTKVKSLNRYYIWTIGCQMNKADSDRLESALVQLGLTSTQTPGDADVVVLNSCVVRQSAEDKVVGMLTSLKPLKQRDPGRVVALMGCMVGPKTDGLQTKFPYVDVFMRPQQYKPLLDLLGERMGVDTEGCLSTFKPPVASVTAYIPVIHGCDEFCTFCIIPYRRGRQQSRPILDIVHEAQLLAARGVREVTLLGQTVDAYGYDLPERPDLADLLQAVSSVERLERVRFLTSHPKYMSDRILRVVAELDKVCPHINVPFQAGDDGVLVAMRRGYTRDDYLRLVECSRATIPGVSLSTDVIVGFPGESEAAFQQTLDLLKQVQFDKVHAAAYSTRPGTIAERKLVDDVPSEEKKRRLEAIERLQEEIATRINARLQGTFTEVLVEDREKGTWKGRNPNDKLVFFPYSSRDLRGHLVNVHIEKTSPWALQGVGVA